MPRTIATISAIEQFINETQTIQHTTTQCSLSLASSSFCSTAKKSQSSPDTDIETYPAACRVFAHLVERAMMKPGTAGVEVAGKTVTIVRDALDGSVGLRFRRPGKASSGAYQVVGIKAGSAAQRANQTLPCIEVGDHFWAVDGQDVSALDDAAVSFRM